MDIELRNGRIHACVRGTGIPVVILHGAGLDHRHMADALEPVFDGLTGWRRVYVDLPGHGRSIAAPGVGTQDAVLDMIGDFLDQGFAGERCVLIGESRGSYLAMGLAHVRPDDILGMMLIGAGGMTPGSEARLPPHRTLVRAAPEVAADAPDAARARFERLVVQRPEILEKIVRTKLPPAGLVDAALAERLRRNFTFSFDLGHPAQRFERPCLFLNGRQDSIAGYRDMMDALELYPRATLAVLDRAGHSLSWEQPELFEALAREWLTRVRDAAAP